MWSHNPQQAMVPASEMNSVQPGSEAWSVVEDMEKKGLELVPVVSDGRIEGVVTRESVGGYLRVLKELGVS